MPELKLVWCGWWGCAYAVYLWSINLAIGSRYSEPGKGEELVALGGIQRVQDNSIFKN